MRSIAITYKAFRKLYEILIDPIFVPITKILFKLNGVKYGNGLAVKGLVRVLVTTRGVFEIGRELRINSGKNYNIIGRQQKCIFWVEGVLVIKDNVGISSSAIICNHQITIGNNVVIGGNTVIYDTDFHSLDAYYRNNNEQDRINARWAPVVIGDNVFIGAHSTILKGVEIGENSVVGACSVVTKSIPPNEVWAGNPASFIRINSSRIV